MTGSIADRLDDAREEERELREIEAIGVAASEAAYDSLVRKIRAGMTPEEWAAAKEEAARAPRTPARCGVTGAEADIEANYEGGLAAFRRDEPRDLTPRHKGASY